VGEGSIIVSGADLVNNLENRTEARQLRHSLLSYMNSGKFNPKTGLAAEEVMKIGRM
jgi:hypothetical protein